MSMLKIILLQIFEQGIWNAESDWIDQIHIISMQVGTDFILLSIKSFP